MADNVTKEKRSEIMSKIRGQDTKIEVLVRKRLFAHGFRYRKNDRRYPGIPDIVLPKFNTVIYVNGCFWHGHDSCKISHIPKSNTEFWDMKIKRNIENDKKNYAALRDLGWNVIIIWEFELRGNNETFFNELSDEIKKNKLIKL
jgi:DNA mismatch endonuclease (patch repair protein)